MTARESLKRQRDREATAVPYLFSIQRLQSIYRLVTCLRMILERLYRQSQPLNLSSRTRFRGLIKPFTSDVWRSTQQTMRLTQEGKHIPKESL
jgi:hypothetical protein